MTLDRWLGKDITNRQDHKSNYGSKLEACSAMLSPLPSSEPIYSPWEVEAKAPLIASRKRRIDNREPPRSYERSYMHRIGVYQPQEMFWRKEARSFTGVASAQLPELPFCVTGTRSLGWTFLGLEKGTVLVVNTSISELGRPVAQIPRLHRNAIKDIDVAPDDSVLLTCSPVCVKQLDLISNRELGEFTPCDDAGFQVCRVGCRPELFLTGTQSGNIHILDRRDHLPVKTLSDVHSASLNVASGRGCARKAIKVSQPVTAAVWAKDHVIASGSRVNQKVRYWDLRNARTYVNEVDLSSYPGSSEASMSGGVTSMVVDSSGRLWAMTRGASIVASTAEYSEPVAHLRSQDLAVANHSTRMTHVTGGKLVGEYVACGGENGVVLMALPSWRSSMAYDRIEASALLAQEAPVLGTSYDAAENTLVSIGYDANCSFFTTQDMII